MDVITGSNGRPVQRRRQRRDGWTPKKRGLFLDELSASCNVRRAAAVAGMTDGTARALRRRDPEFAAAWGAALEDGYTRIETELLERAIGAGAAGSGEDFGAAAAAAAKTAGGSGDETAAAPVVPPPMDDAMRLRVLQLRRARGDQPARVTFASEAEVERALLLRLDRMEAARGRKA